MTAHTGQDSALLRDSTLAQLAAKITRPGYDRSRMFPGLVHIGVGGFNRSHLAVYLDDLLTLGASKPWGEFGVGLLPADKLIHSALAGAGLSLWAPACRFGRGELSCHWIAHGPPVRSGIVWSCA